MARIASVVLSNTTREFDKEYHYIVPGNLDEKVLPGVRVIVPFGKSNRSVEGYVLELFDDIPFDGPKELKEIVKIIDESPVMSESMLKLCAWIKERYICTYSDAVKCMLPPGIGVKSLKIVKLLKVIESKSKNIRRILDVLIENGSECEMEELKNRTGIKRLSGYIKTMENEGAVTVTEEYTSRIKEKTVRVAYIKRPVEEIIEEIESGRVKRIQQIRVLEILIDNEYVSVADILRFSSVSAGVLNTLKKYGFIDFKDIEVKRDPYVDKNIQRTAPLNLTSEQKNVFNETKAYIDNSQFKEILLHGITGSGKTEVYLQLIQYCFEKKRNAIVLVPEISLTPQMVERFKGRFGNEVAVLHSRLSLGERFDQWRLIKEGKIKVAVGARSAVFAPFENLGIIIIDEEHEGTYKSETTPKYHARDVARERCIYHNAVLLSGSATPSVETYYRAENGIIKYLKMLERPNKLQLPGVQLIDMRKELEDGNRSIFSRELISRIEENIKLNQQTILFLNRRGHSSFVLCRSCGFTMRCVNCNISLTYHAHDERLICHYCGYTIRNPKLCPKCKSNYIRHFGTGTQRVEEEIKKQFGRCSVIRMDMDTTGYKNSHEEILREFREKNINILIGTQMIAKGHDFPNVTLVGVLAADSLLNMEDYRATEKTFQLITQVAGRAGRGSLAGRVVIQSYNTEDFSILAACRHDYASFYKQEIKIREKLSFPPFNNIASVILSGLNDNSVFEKANEVKNIISRCFSKYDTVHDIFGPVRAPLSKIKNKFRWRIIIKCENMDILIDVLSCLHMEFYRIKGKSEVDLNMDINPFNML
jgi:primosomal protein N' (replication factor Y)